MKKFSLTNWFRWLTVLTFIIQFVISWNMWISVDRLFPKVYTFSFLPFDFSLGFELLLMGLISVSLILFALKKLETLSIVVFVCGMFLMVSDDIIRFQPWIFVHGLLLVLHHFVKDESAFKRLFILIMSGLFVWAGIMKINIAFLTNTWAFLWSGYFDDVSILMLNIEQLTSITSLADLPVKYLSGIIVPIVEISAGLLILFVRTRKVGAILGIGTQLGVLFFIGPWALDWNHVIWPWNIELAIFFLWIWSDKSVVREKVNWLTLAIVVAFFFLPILSFFRMWDNHLSGSLYSGRNPNAVLFLPNYAGELDTMFDAKLLMNREDRKRDVYVNIDLWCMKDLDAPLYPQERYYKRFGEVFSNGLYRDKMCKLEMHFKHNFNSQVYVKIMTFYNGSLISEKSM